MPEPKRKQWRVGMRNGHNANTVYVIDNSVEWYEESSIATVFGVPQNRSVGDVEPGSEGLRNAYLIARAPELLAFAERIHRFLDTANRSAAEDELFELTKSLLSPL